MSSLSLGSTTGPRPVRRRRLLLRRPAVALAFIAPSFIPLLCFSLGPMAASLALSLYKWDLLRPAHWKGLQNYAALLADPDFRAAIQHTALFIGGYLPLVLVGGMAIALALNGPLRGASIFRTLYFLPVVTSWVVVAFMWRWLLNPQSGIVNHALSLFGIHGPGWWTDPLWAMPSIILASAWKDLGFVMVILLSGLKAIPGEYYEAARVDGANAAARFRYVTLPLVSPALFFVVVISLINGFQVFDQVFIMTGGGPAGASTVVVQEIVTNAFRYGRVGYAAAMSWALFAAILAVTLVQFQVQRRWVTYS